jgi:hypothetical protein
MTVVEPAAVVRPALYWNDVGLVACEVHMPLVGSETWTREGWVPLRQEDIAGWHELYPGVPFRGCTRCPGGAL